MNTEKIQSGILAVGSINMGSSYFQFYIFWVFSISTMSIYFYIQTIKTRLHIDLQFSDFFKLMNFFLQKQG